MPGIVRVQAPRSAPSSSVGPVTRLGRVEIHHPPGQVVTVEARRPPSERGSAAAADVVRVRFDRVVPPGARAALLALGARSLRADGQDGFVALLPDEIPRDRLATVPGVIEVASLRPRVALPWRLRVPQVSAVPPVRIRTSTPRPTRASEFTLPRLASVHGRSALLDGPLPGLALSGVRRASPSQRPIAEERGRVVPGALVVDLLDLELAARLAEVLRGIGATVRPSGRRLHVFVGAGGVPGLREREVTERVEAFPGVLRVTARTLARAMVSVAGGIVWGSAAEAKVAHGAGEIIALTDSGLYTGSLDDLPPGLAGRVVGITSFPVAEYLRDVVENPDADDGTSDLSGHGTHGAGTCVGGDDVVRGIASGARVYVQAVQQRVRWKPGWSDEPESTSFFGLPEHLDPLLADARQRGARVHVHPWGGGGRGSYDSLAEDLDEFVYANRDSVVVVAAGNETALVGPDATPALGTVASIATSKNAIVVGASESLRPELTDAYVTLSQNYFPDGGMAAPMADDPSHVAFFSCRGPTEDLRVKPDLVAPGTWILSLAAPDAVPTKTWAVEAQPGYRYMGGTSMSAAVVGGAAACVRAALRSLVPPVEPSAALVKALLLHAAEPWDQPPDMDRGFGRVALQPLLTDIAKGRLTFFDESPGRALDTGASFAVAVPVAAAGGRLRATMVYTDPPGPELNHNLNLVVWGPGGKQHPANGQPADDFDSRNNAERAVVELDGAGEWTIEVVAVSVASGAQDFALVYQVMSGA